MNWRQQVDYYCERLQPSFWAEPVNALTNALFLMAAVAIILRMRASGRRDLPVMLLAFVVAMTGVGSFLFHTLANRWSLLADVIPIAIFIYGFFFLAMRRFLEMSIVAAVAATVAFAGGAYLAAPMLRPIIGSSAGYVPALLAIFGVGFAAMRSKYGVRGEETARNLFIAGSVFFVSLGFRTLDAPLCSILPMGTHFMWHTLNALTLFLLMRAAMRADFLSSPFIDK